MKSNVLSSKDANWCRNTSLFRTNLQNYKFVNLKDSNDNIYGTVSSMVIKNTGNPSTSQFYLLMLDSIVNDSNNQQLIKYKELNTTLANLFNEPSHLMFSDRELTRDAPVNKICK